MTKTTRLGTGDRQKYDPAYPHDKLEHWPGNARRGVVAGIKESIQVNGFTGALIVQKSTNRVVVGNHRLMAWRELREEDPGRWGDTLPVILWDVNDSQANRYNLADNKTADDASWDEEALVEQLQAIQAADGLVGTGFSDDDLTDLLANMDDGEDEDIPEDFPAYDESIQTEHQCPSCGYVWSGSTKPAAASEGDEDDDAGE